MRNIARMNVYPTGEYTISASDVDTEMVGLARRNAERAGVADDITFSIADFSHHSEETQS